MTMHDLLVSDGIACRLLERLAPALLIDGSTVLRLDLSEADLDAIMEQAEDAADYRIQSAMGAIAA